VYWALAAFCAIVLIAGGGSDAAGEPLETLGLVAGAAGCWRLGCMRIVATPERLKVIGLVSVRSIAWQDVVSISATDGWGIEIERRGTRKCKAWGFIPAGESQSISQEALDIVARLNHLTLLYTSRAA
jgi:hypothetical protein